MCVFHLIYSAFNRFFKNISYFYLNENKIKNNVLPSNKVLSISIFYLKKTVCKNLNSKKFYSIEMLLRNFTISID